MNSLAFLRVLRVPVFCLLSATPAIGATTNHELKLPHDLEQGQLVIGHAPPGTRIDYAGRALRVGDDGVFVFGLERDAAPEVTLQVRWPDGTATAQPFAVNQRTYHIERVEGLPQKTVTPDRQTAARIAREQAAVAEARTRDDAREDFLRGFAPPVSQAQRGRLRICTCTASGSSSACSSRYSRSHARRSSSEPTRRRLRPSIRTS